MQTCRRQNIGQLYCQNCFFGLNICHCFQGILLTGAVLETLTCGEGGNSELSKILLVPEKQQAALQAYRMAVCGDEAGQRAKIFGEMSEELRDQIDTQRVLEKVHARTTQQT